MTDYKQGFAGFDALVSDLSDLPKPAVKASVPPQKALPAAEDIDPSPSSIQVKKSPSSGGRSTVKLVVGLILAVAGIVSYGLIVQNQKKSAISDYSTTYAPPVTSPEPVALPEPGEVRPPVGEGQVLYASQIRYCLSQDIRIEGAQSVLDNTSQADVDRFNAMIADYNSRCVSFRYYGGVLNRVQAEVEARRTLLALEGRSAFLAGSKAKPAQPVKPTETSSKKSTGAGVPKNAQFDSASQSWVCLPGYKKIDGQCR